MNIGSVITRPPITEHEIETTSSAKPPSAGTPRETSFSESTAQESFAHESPSLKLSKPPLDDPALKAFVSETLSAGGSGYSGPSIRMRDNFDDLPDTGADVGPTDVKNKEGSDNLGFDFASPSRFEGDGPTKFTTGHTSGGTSTNSSTSSNGTSGSSGTSTTSNSPSAPSSTTPTSHPQKK